MRTVRSGSIVRKQESEHQQDGSDGHDAVDRDVALLVVEEVIHAFLDMWKFKRGQFAHLPVHFASLFVQTPFFQVVLKDFPFSL